MPTGGEKKQYERPGIGRLFINGVLTCSVLSKLFREVTANCVRHFSCADLILRAQHTVAGKEEQGEFNSPLLKLYALECFILHIVSCIEYIIYIS